jgi:hypothetical protein
MSRVGWIRLAVIAAAIAVLELCARSDHRPPRRHSALGDGDALVAPDRRPPSRSRSPSVIIAAS